MPTKRWLFWNRAYIYWAIALLHIPTLWFVRHDIIAVILVVFCGASWLHMGIGARDMSKEWGHLWRGRDQDR